MAMRLKISNLVDVLVQFSLTEGSEQVEHKFTLKCERKSVPEIMGAPDKSIPAFLNEVVTGWEGQKIVVDDDDKPVPFSADAFQMLLGLNMIEGIIYKEYLKTCAARAKN